MNLEVEPKILFYMFLWGLLPRMEPENYGKQELRKLLIKWFAWILFEQVIQAG